MMDDFIAVIMAGGQGQRFWPLSTADRPKQFLDLEQSGRTLLQSTYDRTIALTKSADRILVATGQRYTGLVRQQLPDLPASNLIIEPEPRDSAPAIAMSSLIIRERFGNALVGYFSSDHSIENTQQFVETIQVACTVAREQGGLVTVGIRPTRAATGYGYIRLGATVNGGYKVARFVEKPSIRLAETYVESHEYLWNAGIFVWQSDTALAQMRIHAPEIIDPLENAVRSEGDYANIFRELPRISIDYALMEKSDRVFVVPASFDWDDIGDWVALERRLAESSLDSNTIIGRHFGHDTTGNIIFTDGPEDAIITLGVKNMIIVKRGDTVLLLPKERVQEIKGLLNDERLAEILSDVNHQAA